MKTSRNAFTLVELMIVLLIVAIIAAVTLPVMVQSVSGRQLDGAARIVQGEITAAAARAQLNGSAGVRLIPDATTIKRLADGSIDPTAELAYDRMIPLTKPPGYQAGKVAVRTDLGYSAFFAAKRLILEQEVAYDEPASGLRLPNEPTSWAWNVRLGDSIEIAGARYTVCGPMARGPAQGNAESFINYDPDWPILDRGDGPAEWLYLVNGKDDDGDGYADNGFDGLDNDCDGVVDNVDEWSETETWGQIPSGGLRDAAYTIRRRPVPGPSVSGVSLAGVVVDASGWADAVQVKSSLPVDPWTGTVDLMVGADGRVQPITVHGSPSPARWFHIWLVPRGEVAATGERATDARLVSIDARTGRMLANTPINPADAVAAKRAAERGDL